MNLPQWAARWTDSATVVQLSHRTTSHPSSVITTPTRRKSISRRRPSLRICLESTQFCPASPSLRPNCSPAQSSHDALIQAGLPSIGRPHPTSHLSLLALTLSELLDQRQKQLGMSSRDSGTAMHLWEAAHASASVCTCRPAICHLLIRLLVPPTSSLCLRPQFLSLFSPLRPRDAACRLWALPGG